MTTHHAALVLSGVALAGCLAEADCQRRIDAAHVDALRDAAACRWEPEALSEPECTRLDRRPLRTYQGVWCSDATLACIREHADADALCFGGPDDEEIDP